VSDLAIPDDADLTPHAGEKLGRFADLPAEVRKPVKFFWALNRHLLPTPIPLVLRLQVWIAKEQLTPAEVRQVLSRLVSPEAAATHRFASDLLCDLAAAVAEVVGRRRKLAEQQRRRDETDAAAANAVPAEQLRHLLAGVGRGV
jgi:hypothetical protein